jgi:uncharacterized membrane protein
MQPRSHASSTPLGPSATAGGAWRRFAAGLIPLGLLAVTSAIALGLTLAARELSAGLGFFTQQWITVAVLVVGVLVALAVYAVALRRALAQARTLAQAGDRSGANAIYWALALTVVVVVLPIVLAALIPQSPAP